MHNSDWVTSNDIPTYREDKLYLFRVDLTEMFNRPDSLFTSFLTANEVERCSKFRFHKDRVRYRVGRYAIRRLLNQYEADGEKVKEFQFNDYGKPRVSDQSNIKFNLSHSGKYLLIGIGRHHEVGVDTEIYNETIDHLDLARSVFSQQERTALELLSDGERIHAFYRCWSMKESFIKAVGRGLQLPLDQFSVDLTISQSDNQLLSVPWKPQLMNELKTNIVYIDAGYSAAYTCHQSIEEVHHIDISASLLDSNSNL